VKHDTRVAIDCTDGECGKCRMRLQDWCERFGKWLVIKNSDVQDVRGRAQGRVPVRLRRCPLVPTRYKRAACWRLCRYYDKAGARCTLEQQP